MKIDTNFSVALFGEIKKLSSTLSSARCRIFYKYANRNGTYITDKFAEKLLSTIAYAPVKGIFEVEENDFTDHGEKRSEGRIYGVVPENPNIAWENHLDEDGIMRTYACADVILYTALYDEAKLIPTKGQSMELYAPSLKYHQEYINGKQYYVYDDGEFLGLQALGDDVEPCFEGASFYSLNQFKKEFKALLNSIDIDLKSNTEGGSQMNFKLSDQNKYDLLFQAINPNYNEENGWIIDYVICAIYDDYALVVNNQSEYERVYYEKDDENDSITISKKKRCYIVDVDESEKASLETIRKLNNDTYEKAEEIYAIKDQLELEKQELEQEKTNFEIKISEQNETISTLNTDKDALNSELEETKTTVATLTTKLSEATNTISELQTYKKQQELTEKMSIITKYQNLLSKEVLDSFTEKLDTYTNILDLEKDLAFEYVSNNNTVFTIRTNNEIVIPIENEPNSGINALLDKHKNKN